jgi:transposase InsO family protein
VNNNKIERAQSTIRERSKVMRGMQNNGTAEDLIAGFKAYYNFVRPHQGLEGKTPAEVANLDLGLGENRLLVLIKKAVEHRVKNGAH